MPIYHLEGQISDVNKKFEEFIRNKEDEAIILSSYELEQFEMIFNELQGYLDECEDKIDELECEGQEPNADDMERLDEWKLAFEKAQDKFSDLEADRATLQDLVEIIDELNG
ncbi:hypothetical protein AM305_09336 [Actinobacillus minor NM305]|uniref:Uncharacterized protein n=1 Tax=Actinobacillus minor NM305 TaxID=637911 RepID=C5S1X0_9PAST|nr:hypothetical protein [Actinobacillus minor]EER47073.1 hypothetical protein AM305_09336 [Actinobacillus minor NM305]